MKAIRAAAPYFSNSHGFKDQFFFSSRRRHTRCLSDWSSDVCSSDLTARAAHEQASRKLTLLGLKPSDFQQRIQVKAPISGKVLDVAVAPGEYRTDTATPLMTVADLTVVWVSADVPENAIRVIKVGDRVGLSFVAYPGETFAGRVARIADVLDKETRTIKVHVEMPNPQGRFRPE